MAPGVVEQSYILFYKELTTVLDRLKSSSN